MLQGDLSAQMVAGIDRYFLRETEQSPAGRQQFWQRDFSSSQAYDTSVQPNRERLRKMIGAVDARLPVKALDTLRNTRNPSMVGESYSFTVEAVRWPVFEGVFGEGLFLYPTNQPRISVVAIPDADQTPEMLVGLAPGLAPEHQFARRLAEHGCQVLVPVLVDRQDTWSGNPEINRQTNLPHREWIYRQAYPLGRHIVGYEVQKVLAAVEYFAGKGQQGEGNARKIGVAGYGEGGLIAFYAAALDPRIEAALVSGFFDSRQRLWEEPIYRNLFGLLREFGDAEVASLIAPRALVVEHSEAPKVKGPPKPRAGRTGAAPGKITTPDYATVEAEFERARTLLKGGDPKVLDRFSLITGTEGMTTGPGSDRALLALLNALGDSAKRLTRASKSPTHLRAPVDLATRQQRQVKQLQEHTQKLLRESERVRAAFFWNRLEAATARDWEAACAPLKQILWDDITGRLPPPALPANPRTRRFEPATADSGGITPRGWAAYDVVLDVYPDVFAWGILLLPGNLWPGERRPVVVCQHGLEGLPADVITEDSKNPAFGCYKGFAARLADRGFIVFAPHNPYRGGDTFRQLQRKANPLKASLFSVIIAQHNRILDWLGMLPFVDAKRIAFYGLSYGGNSSMRVPSVLDGYALSISSGSFNDWTRKNVSLEVSTSYMFHGEYEMPDFNLGGTFGHAEMAALIVPRPFMVERGHNDPVGLDKWVADEYAKVRRLYDRLDVGNHTAIEFFDGGHTINGVGTFDFLHQQLKWPEP